MSLSFTTRFENEEVYFETLWPYDNDPAWEFGNIFAFLQKQARSIQQIDIQIAAIATSLGNCTVVTKDSDFAAIPGLDIVDWTQTG